MKAALIGCGRIGYKFDDDPKRTGVWTHAKAYSLSPSVEFVGVYDLNSDEARKCASLYTTKAFNNIGELLDAKPDVISVAVNPEYHEEVIKSIYDTTKLIWVEKPFIGKYNCAKQIVNNGGAAIHVNYQRRHCEGYEYIKSLGNPNHTSVVYSSGLVNTASHYIDAVLYLYGIPIEVLKTNDTDFVLKYEDFNVVFSMLSADYYYCTATIYYVDKKIVVPPIADEIYIWHSISSQKYSEYMELSDRTVIPYKYDPMCNQVNKIEQHLSGQNVEINDGLATLAILEKLETL